VVLLRVKLTLELFSPRSGKNLVGSFFYSGVVGVIEGLDQGPENLRIVFFYGPSMCPVRERKSERAFYTDWLVIEI